MSVGLLDHRATYAEAICPYCAVGCRLWSEMAYGQILRVKGVADAPANRGHLCAKGATLHQTVSAPDRATVPLVRRDRTSELRPTDWQRALREVSDRLRSIIREHGPDAVAFYGSGQLDTQAAYCAVKLFKGALGTNNTDSNSRLCMSTAVAAYRTSLGSDGPPTCYDDIESADVIVIIGANMAEAHPVTFDRIKAAKKLRPDMKLVVIDPRRTATAERADLHLSVVPGGDIGLLNAVAKLLLDRSGVDTAFVESHTHGFAEFQQSCQEADLDSLAVCCGVSIQDLQQFARWLRPPTRWLSFYCMGLGQSTVGMWKINSLINLHLLTGAIGRPGCGPFSLTGQPNAMGGREVGLLSHQLPGYRFVENAEHRAEVERHWNLAAGTISPRPGLTAVEMFRALERGRLKGIWIAATNPAVSLPDLHHVRRALKRAELVVVNEAYHPTETSQLADIVLPVASWGEREWMSTNMERMVSHSEQLVSPPGSALPDWQIFCRTAQAMGISGFEFTSADQVWDEWIEFTGGRLCDMRGMPAHRLRAARHLQWPCPDQEHAGTPRLYTDHRFAHADGRARFVYRPQLPAKEACDHEFPLVLTTGRLYSHWHTLTRTSKSPKLMQRDPEPFVEVHPQLAAQLGVQDEEMVQVSSRRGTVTLRARLTDHVPPTLVFIPMHWGDLYAPGDAVNYLTLSAIGTVAKQPELKCCAVTVEKIDRSSVLDE